MQKLGGSEELLDFLSSMPVETFNEGLEEIASDVLNPTIDYIATGEADWPTLEQLIEDGIIGVILGAEGQLAGTAERGIRTVANFGGSGKLTIVEYIPKSVGAKSKNHSIYNPVSGEYTELVEGTYLTQPKDHVIAGRGRLRQIDDIDRLLSEYPGTKAEDWTKEKGYGYVYDEFGEARYAELHWYQNPIEGKVEMKIKVQPGGGLYLDD